MTRAAILDATERILREDGYAAVTSREVAAAAGLKSQLVHYYFGTMDDLFLALFQRVGERHSALLAEAAAARRPLRALWKLSIDPKAPRRAKEFIALATHRPHPRREIARSAERTRSIAVALLTRIAQDRGPDRIALPPTVLAVLMEGAARLIVSESALGTNAGHAETIDVIEAMIERFEAQPTITAGPPPARDRG